MLLKKASWILAALLVSVTIVACGADDEADPTATQPPAAAATATTATDDAEATATEAEDVTTPTEEAATPTEAADVATPTAVSDATATREPAGVDATATEVVAEPTEAPATETVEATQEAVTEDEAALLAMLLAEEDLPEGWVLTSTDVVTAREAGVTFCNAEPYQSPDGRLAAVEVEFEVTPDMGPFLLQNLTAYSGDVATEAMDYTRGIIAECTEWTDEDGTAYQLTDLELPEFGDESFGMTLSFEAPGIGTIPTDFAFVRVGGVLLSAGFMTTDENDPTDFAAIVQRATEKVQESGYQPQ